MSADAERLLYLRQQLFLFPARFDVRHDKILAMRFELRCWLLEELTGEFVSYLFGQESLRQRAFLPPEKWLPFLSKVSHSHNGRPCARKLERGEPTNRCLTCGLDDTCVLCKYCFNPADHEGHNVFVKISSRDDGGICDCGDTEAWKREVHCLADEGPQEFRELPEAFAHRASLVLDVMLDYVVDVLAGASLATQTTSKKVPVTQLSQASELRADLYGAMDTSPLRREDKRWCLLVWDDDKRSVTDLFSSLQLATERSRSSIKMIMRKIQTSGRATVDISNLAEMVAMRKKIRHFRTSIRSVEDVMREEMVLEMINVALDLCHCYIDHAEPTALVKLVGRALLKAWNIGSLPRDPSLSESLLDQRIFFDQDILLDQKPEPDALVYAMSDLQDRSQAIPDEAWEEHLRINYEDDDTNPPSDEELFGPSNVFGKLAEELSSSLRDSSLSGLQSEGRIDAARQWPIEKTNARVKYLVFFDVRLYKSLRQKLTDLYVAALVSNPELKLQVALIYADVYPLLVDQYTHIDHDPDSSVTTALSTQLFTTPSIATTLMETKAFDVYMKMLYKLFAKHGRLNPKVFRNRRLGQVFHEFGYLLWRNTKKESVGLNPHRVALTASFLALFQGLAPMQRQLHQHVEYENERWVYCYATMPFALQLARSTAVGVEHAVQHDLESAHRAVSTLCLAIRQWEEGLARTFPENKTEIGDRIRYGAIPERSWQLSGTSIFEAPVSLLHPVHCFLSWLLQFSTINDLQILRQMMGISDLQDCRVFNASLDTLAVLSQISVGYWVRNGYAMRIQLQCYRDATLRDLSYARDIFITQVAFCILDPNTIFLNLVHRFAMSDWPNSTLGDEQQSFYIFDEFLHCLTFLLCDRIKFQNLEGVALKKACLVKEILQVLGFETMTYSELTKLVPESMVVDEHFDMVLSQCADFISPKGAYGVGKYALKPEYYKDFDPHYTHFTIARTEEAEKVAEARLGTNHLPPLLPLQGAWSNLGNFTRCAAFASFVQSSLTKVRQSNVSQSEQTMSRIIHLLLMALKNDEQVSFPHRLNLENGCFDSITEMILSPSSPSETAEDTSILRKLHDVLQDTRFVGLHPKVEFLLSELHKKDSRIVAPMSRSADLSQQAKEDNIKRREKGKAMQEKVLADFMRQQQSFLESNMMEDDDDESSEGVENQDGDTCNGFSFPKYCVLCRMPDEEESIYGVLTYTSQLKIMRELPLHDPYWVKEAYSGDPSLDVEHAHTIPLPDQDWHDDTHNDEESVIWGPAFPNEYIRETSVVQGCGHGVHYKCFTTFLRNQQQQRIATRFSPENFGDGEFLCPLCRGLNNCFMPVLWSDNKLDVESFMKRAEDPIRDMRLAIQGKNELQTLDVVVQNTLSALNEKFLSAIQRHDFSDSFHSNVRDVLLEQMLRIKRTSTSVGDLQKTCGLRMIYRTLANTISQVEVALRGQKHATPFGGLLVDQLPARTTQFLRIFAKYINTLTGFIMSSFIQLGKEPEINGEVSISPVETLTKLVEMIFFGIPINGSLPSTVVRQAIVIEIGRVLANVHKINLSLISNASEISPELSAAIALWVPSQDPRLVYGMMKYHLTVVLRSYALLVFSICGKYDPDDYAGMMSEPEHDRLLAYLQLPPLQEIILNLSNSNTPEGVMQSELVRNMQEKGAFCDALNRGHIEYPGVYKLVALPNRLDAMFNIKGRKIPIDPTVCLLCGHMCSIQASEFGLNGLGPCNEHMVTCGVTQGLYLLPRRNFVLLLLPNGRGTFIPAPYLDLHGEPDENMRRGRPHYLQPLRYESLMQEVWLWNGLPSLVARKLDQNQDNGGWETL